MELLWGSHQWLLVSSAILLMFYLEDVVVAGKVETCLNGRQLPTFPQALLRVGLFMGDWNQNLQYTLSKAGDISI
ncbi:MAG: hypothetical protein HY644_01905 [Acidobacteria bacterium]|nr:hypothetical protein [Acidobacteriota bacterium]